MAQPEKVVSVDIESDEEDAESELSEEMFSMEDLVARIKELEDEVATLKAAAAKAAGGQQNPPVPTPNKEETQPSTCSVWNVFATPKEYVRKWKGGGKKGAVQWPKAKLPNWRSLFFSFTVAFTGISILGVSFGTLLPVWAEAQPLLNHFWLEPTGRVGWIGSMGAVAVLVSAAPESGLIQPRNLFIGNLMAATIGVGMRTLFHGYPDLQWLAGALAVAISISIMQLTKTVHPPAGATAFIAVLGPESVHRLGWWYILNPVLLDVSIMFGVTMLILNLSKYLRYPYHWI